MSDGLEALAGALAGPDVDARVWATGTVTAIGADGLVSVDLGRGPVSCQALASYTPGTGDVVAVLRQTLADGARPLVLGATRTTNATTVDVQAQLAIVANVVAAPVPGGASGSNTFNTTTTKSYRSSDGWSRDTVYQGVYSPAYGVWRGAYFYGTAPSSTLGGVRCTRLRIRIARTGSGGKSAGVPMNLARHVHAIQPGGPPIQRGERFSPGSLAWGAVSTFDLPVSWGQDLIDGGARGIMHVDDSSDAYAIMQSRAVDVASGQLIIDWATP